MFWCAVLSVRVYEGSAVLRLVDWGECVVGAVSGCVVVVVPVELPSCAGGDGLGGGALGSAGRS